MFRLLRKTAGKLTSTQRHHFLPRNFSASIEVLQERCNNCPVITSPTPLQERFMTLREHLDNSPKSNLRALDEFFAVAVQIFQQEAEKDGGEDDEGVREAVQFYQKIQSGSGQDKWLFCIAQQKNFLNFAEQHEKEGKTKLANQYRRKAHNWQKRANTIKQINCVSPSLAPSNGICDNSRDIAGQTEHYDLEPFISLQERYFSLEKYFKTTDNPTLQKLDEYLTVSIDYYRQKAQKEKKDQGELQEAVNELQRVARGSYYREKNAFCLVSQQSATTFAERFEKEGKGELAKRSRVEASNWGKLAQACQQVKPGNNRRK